jgi:hypothetical protein
MMRSNHRRSHGSEGIFVLSCDAFPKETGLPGAEAARATNVLDSGRQVCSDSGRDAADGRGGRWASLDAHDREVFNIWAKRVTAFYSLLIISLVAAMLLGAYTPADRKLLAASPAMERSSPEMPAPITGRVGK